MPPPRRPKRAWAYFRIIVFVVLAIIGALFRHARTDQPIASVSSPPATMYKADFPWSYRSMIRAGTDLYYFNDAVGEVDFTEPVGNAWRAHFHIDSAFVSKWEAMSPTLKVGWDRDNRTHAWIEVIPKRAEGQPMTPAEAARIWGRGA